jgi:antitoxin HicB
LKTKTEKKMSVPKIVPELDGCVTHGDTLEEASKMAEEAIGGYLESLKSRNLAIPIPMCERNFSGQFRVRISPNLHRDLTIQAELENVSLNKLVEQKLSK